MQKPQDVDVQWISLSLAKEPKRTSLATRHSAEVHISLVFEKPASQTLAPIAEVWHGEKGL